MIARVFRYSYAQAKTRAMRGKLLGPDDWHYLLRMKSLEDILRYLKGTDYAASLSGLPGATYVAGTVSLALHNALFKDYSKLLRAVPKRSSKLLLSLLARYDAENLKTLLRGIWQAKPAQEIRLLLYGLGALSRLPIEGLLQVRQVPAAVDLLKSTIFHAPLLHALSQFKAQGRLFPLEIAADMAAFKHIAANIKTLRGLDQRGAEDLAGEFIDWVNVCWLVRFRHLYGLSPEEAINYALPGGNRLTIRDLGKLSRAVDLSTFFEAMPAPYRKALDQVQHWEQVQPIFQRRLIYELYGSFQKDPFQIRIELSYLLLKEMEVKSLESLVSAIDLGESPERLVDLIGLPVKGDVRV